MTSLRRAETAFRWMMRAYPARFRRTHGLALFELFRDESRAAQARGGALALGLLVARTAFDTLASAPAAWRDAARGRAGARRRSRRAAIEFAGLAHDARIAVRRLAAAPGFTAVAVATLAIGIGANTTIFAVVNAVLLRPLGARDPDRVVRILARSGTGAAGASARRFSVADFDDYRARTTTIEALSGVNLATFVLAADNGTDQILGEIVSGGYQALLGARAAQGRLLADADDRREAPLVAVIGDALWRRRFGAQPVVGRQVLLNNRSYTIVGVATPDVGGSFIGAPVDVWIPIESSGTSLGARWESDRGQRTLMLIGRLRPGVSRERAQAEMQSVATAVARETTPALHPIVEVVPGTLATGDQRRLARMFLSMLLGVVALVLVIACANVANLLLARALGRRRELAVRIAIGASRWRLARMLGVESLLLSAAAGAGALLLSMWTSRAFAAITPLPTLTLRFDVRPDWRVVAFTAAAALASAAMLAIAGALQAIAPDVAPALKEDAISSTGVSRSRLRGAMAAMQIAVSLLLVVGGALFMRSARHAAEIDLGFEPRGVVVLDVDAAGGRTSAASVDFFRQVLRRTTALPDVTAAAVSTRAPLDSSTPIVRVNARGSVPASDDPLSPSASFLVVSPSYFDVVKTPILSGRPFAETDDAERQPVAIVNETLAARLWPSEDAIGRRLWLEPQASPVSCVIVGVARDSKYLTIGEERQAHVYLSFAQQPRRGMALLVRSRAPADRVTAAVQGVLRSVDPNVQGFFARTLAQHAAVSTLPVRVAAGVTGLVAAIALGLALVGLYSLVSFLAAERTHEIGVRMALGAQPRDVLRLVGGYGLRLVSAGLAVGLPLAIGTSHLLRSLLYGIGPTDPFAFGAASAAVLLVSAAACYLPARRAMRLDPIVALKSP